MTRASVQRHMLRADLERTESDFPVIFLARRLLIDLQVAAAKHGARPDWTTLLVQGERTDVGGLVLTASAVITPKGTPR